MRINGHINYKIETGGGKDPDTGFKIPVEVSWSEDIPCSFRVNHDSSLGHYENGVFTKTSYVVDIEAQELPTFDTIRIYDDQGNRLGLSKDQELREYPVIATPEHLATVDRIRITV